MTVYGPLQAIDQHAARRACKRLAAVACAAVMAAVAMQPVAASTAVENVYLECNGEAKSRLLAFQASDLEIVERREASRNLHIEIRNQRLATVMAFPSEEVLFTSGQCKLSTMKIACEVEDDKGLRQLFISRTSGDALFEGYSQTDDTRSALLVERYSCIKESREPLF